MNNKYQERSGPEIENLADYWGQPTLVVRDCSEYDKEKYKHHTIPKAYNNIIAKSEYSSSRLSISTDCNRSGSGYGYPLRINLEFRADPNPTATKRLLHLIHAYDTWLIQQKQNLRALYYQTEIKFSRHEEKIGHMLPLNAFIEYYNSLDATKEKLILNTPQEAFNPECGELEYSYEFSKDAEWFLRLEQRDLDPAYAQPVYYAQYNLTIPVGFVFDPLIRNTFKLQQDFSLLFQEKEFTPDFNESRPHSKFFEYEQQIFQSSVTHADRFFVQINASEYAFGIKDFLRGVAYEIAMISTSKNYLNELFQEDALWVKLNQSSSHEAAELKKPRSDDSTPAWTSKKEQSKIAHQIAETLCKSLFPYLMKATLATFFKHLHPYEKFFLRHISQEQIRDFCQGAVMLANGGLGHTNKRYPADFVIYGNDFMDKFTDFYQETFMEQPPSRTNSFHDPVGYLIDHFIDFSTIRFAVPSLYGAVLEVRMPEQGNQKYSDLVELCHLYPNKLNQLLADKVPYLQTCRQQLQALWIDCQATQPKAKIQVTTQSTLQGAIVQQSKLPKLSLFKNSKDAGAHNALNQAKKAKKNYRVIPKQPIQHSYEPDFLWPKPKSYNKRDLEPVSSRTRQSNKRPKV